MRILRSVPYGQYPKHAPKCSQHFSQSPPTLLLISPNMSLNFYQRVPNVPPIITHYIMNQIGIKRVPFNYQMGAIELLSAPCARVPNTACFGYPCVPNARPFCYHFMLIISRPFCYLFDIQAHPAPRYPTAVNQLLVHLQSVPDASFFCYCFVTTAFYGWCFMVGTQCMTKV